MWETTYLSSGISLWALLRRAGLNAAAHELSSYASHVPRDSNKPADKPPASQPVARQHSSTLAAGIREPRAVAMAADGGQHGNWIILEANKRTHGVDDSGSDCIPAYV